ncbi:hypothetical protein [Chitinasiproducens palmae]|uniref:Uncharacterized protein n=1 Tax=Chitinasiproducens palmae TaxID=1770053 RepID=A0A1H2PSN7_9BURK|nr:hypothetical protein [Chitinasiproducens palmae]SDV49170.1 hypothetical protein SAMN05216551_107124 [Chitinasiproducens palmae]
MAYSPPTTFVDVTPTNGGSTTIPVSDGGTPLTLCLKHTSVLLTHTFVWPADAPDGQKVEIACPVAITTVAHSLATGAAAMGMITSMVAGAGGTYRFRGSNKTWYKVS